MSLPKFITDKIDPFINSFNRDLKEKLLALDMEASSKGLLGSGVQFKAYQAAFIELLGALLDKIKQIIFNQLRHKEIGKPWFCELRDDIQEIADPFIVDFLNYLEKNPAILNPQVLAAIVYGFKEALHSDINKRFVDYELEFDAIA